METPKREDAKNASAICWGQFRQRSTNATKVGNATACPTWSVKNAIGARAVSGKSLLAMDASLARAARSGQRTSDATNSLVNAGVDQLMVEELVQSVKTTIGAIR